MGIFYILRMNFDNAIIEIFQFGNFINHKWFVIIIRSDDVKLLHYNLHKLTDRKTSSSIVDFQNKIIHSIEMYNENV